MKKHSQTLQIVSVIAIACLSMAYFDTVLMPGYFIRSLFKIGMFLLLPLLYARLNPKVHYGYLFKFNWPHFKISLLLSISVSVFLLAAYWVLGPFFDFSNVTKSMEKNAGITADNFLIVALYISIANAFLEEFFFRGFAYLELKKSTGKKTALLISSLAFSLYHISIMSSWFTLPLMFLLLSGLFVGGLIFNWLNESSNSLYSSWMVHMFSNFAINIIGYSLFMTK